MLNIKGFLSTRWTSVDWMIYKVFLLFKVAEAARGDHEREGEQDHHLCGNQEEV